MKSHKSTIDKVKLVLRQHILLIVICLSYFFSGKFFLEYAGSDQSGRLSGSSYYMLQKFAPIFLIFFGMFCLVEARRTRPENLLRHCLSKFRADFLKTEILLPAAIVYLLLPLVTVTYTNLKLHIPYLNPFSWDPYFAELDKLLHFGKHPWEWLQPVLGYPIVTLAIHFGYIFWLLAVYGILFWQIFDLRRPKLRMQFFLSFVLVWVILGSVAAIWLSSAGPVYFDRVTGLQGPYGPLMAYLNDVVARQQSLLGDWIPSVVQVQDLLWQMHESSEGKRFGGISAMPSLHLASVTILTLLCWATSRRLGILLVGFLGLIMLGSVHLAWHYAIDGYAGIVGALAIWWMVGKLLTVFEAPLGFDGTRAGQRHHDLCDPTTGHGSCEASIAPRKRAWKGEGKINPEPKAQS